MKSDLHDIYQANSWAWMKGFGLFVFSNDYMKYLITFLQLSISWYYIQDTEAVSSGSH